MRNRVQQKLDKVINQIKLGCNTRYKYGVIICFAIIGVRIIIDKWETYIGDYKYPEQYVLLEVL